jgi:hypothetical protein
MIATPDLQLPERLPYDHEKFVNRHEELRLIVDRAKRLASSSLEPRVIVFRGARGSGKSWLLHEIEHQLKQPPLVVPILVELTVFSALPPDDAVRRVIYGILGEMRQKNISGFANEREDERLNILTSVLIDAIHACEGICVILVDGVDESSNELLTKLEDHCLSPLAVEPNVLIVLAGRGREYIWKSSEFRLKSEEHDLSPFDPIQTLEQLRKQAPQAAQYADEIYELSSGVPWSNYLLRTLPASKADALQRTKDVLLGSETRLLARPYLEALSVLRAFDENRMPVMFAAYFQQPATNWTYADCRNIRSQLTELRLAWWDRDEGEFTLDPAIRSVIENALHESDKPKWVVLHCTAYCLYRGWAKRYDRTRNRWRAEMTYHADKLHEAGYSVDNCIDQSDNETQL